MLEARSVMMGGWNNDGGAGPGILRHTCLFLLAFSPSGPAWPSRIQRQPGECQTLSLFSWWQDKGKVEKKWLGLCSKRYHFDGKVKSVPWARPAT